MTKTASILCSLLGLVVLSVALKQMVGMSLFRQVPSQKDNSSVSEPISKDAKTKQITQAIEVQGLSVPPNNSSSRSQVTSAITDNTPKTAPDRMVLAEKGNLTHETRAPLVPPADSADPNAVIGRPFPVSPSVVSECQQDRIKWGDKAECINSFRHLAQLTSEPRDPVWAAAMETKLQQQLIANAKQYSQFTIRALECRSTICAIEVAVLNERYTSLGHVDGALGGPILLSYESEPQGGSIRVWVELYTRR